MAKKIKQFAKDKITVKIAENFNLSKTLARLIVANVFDTIIHTLIQDGYVTLRDFGTINLKLLPSITVSDKFGELRTLPDRYVPHFKASRKMKKAVRLISPPFQPANEESETNVY